jgi:hypothetical protein
MSNNAVPDSAGHVAHSSGRPLDSDTRAFMESQFGCNLVDVRVHTDAKAAESARTLNALAYTTGRQIVFAAGRYDPGSVTGRQLLAHEIVHSLQQVPNRPDVTGIQRSSSLVSSEDELEREADTVATQALRVSPLPAAPLSLNRGSHTSIGLQRKREDLDRLQQEIDRAIISHPELAPTLRQVSLRGVTYQDRTEVMVLGENTPHVFPTQITGAQAGFYLFRWDSDGNVTDMIDMTTWALPPKFPQLPILAGEKEARELRSNRIGAIWITQTVTEPPKAHRPSPDELELPLSPADELEESTFREELAKLPKRQLVIPGLTGGVFDPDYKGADNRQGYFKRPLNFTFYTHDGTSAFVSRTLAGREFFYLVSIERIANYLRFYPFEYAGLAAAGTAMLAEIMVDVTIGFIPLIGPIYTLLQVSVSTYRAIRNWNHLSGWEKALVGLNVLLSAVPILRGGAKFVRGAAAFQEGVETLVSSGLTRSEASRLMLAAGIFQSDRAALRIVDTLGDVLRRGERLSFSELQQVQRIFRLMLQRLPPAERTIIAASYATQSVQTASAFLRGVELTERHLIGLRRLTPEVMTALERVAADEPAVVQRIALMAERSEQVAAGINELHLATGQRFLTRLAGSLGEDVLERIGSGAVKIEPELGAFVKRARTATGAYRRLMQGGLSGGKNVSGLVKFLTRTRGPALPLSLAAVEAEFSRTFLTTLELDGLSKLSDEVRTALGEASDADLKLIAGMAGRSPDVVRGINALVPRLPSVHLARLSLLRSTSPELLAMLGRSGTPLSDELLHEVARLAQRGQVTRASETLLRGFTPARTSARVPGIIDVVAGQISSAASLSNVLRAVEIPAQRAALFARWAVANPAAIDGIEAIMRLRPKDYERIIEQLQRAFGTSQTGTISVLRAIGAADRAYGAGIRLERLIGELAGGAEKSMGASLTLSFITRRAVGKITAFEHSVAVPGFGQRVYDLTADSIDYEFKFWLGFGGRPAEQASSEFARDVVLHAGTGFRNLRWVISRDAIRHLPAIESMMRGVISRPSVRAALHAQGITAEQALQRLEGTLAESDRLIVLF